MKNKPCKWVADVNEMHQKFGFHRKVNELGVERLRELMDFRLKQIQEEVNELEEAIDNEDPEEIVDALIDMMVFSIGTLDLFHVNADAAWNEVLAANIAKNPGIKSARPNPFGFPDLIKPEGWLPPSHEGNHGYFKYMYKKEEADA